MRLRICRYETLSSWWKGSGEALASVYHGVGGKREREREREREKKKRKERERLRLPMKKKQ